MDEMKELLKANRPNLTDNSLKTYLSNLKNLYKKVFGEDSQINVKYFTSKQKDIIKYLEDVNPNKRKTILSALYVLTLNKKYNELMSKDIHSYNSSLSSETKTDKEIESWIDKDELELIYTKLKGDAEYLYKKKNLTMEDKQIIQQYIILSLYILTIPRRALDYTEMKTKNIDEESDNFIKSNHFIYNRYKTHKFYGQQIEKIPTPLVKVLNKWMNINPDSEYLLFDINGKKLNPTKLSQRLNKIFCRKVSVNSLRKYFVSSKYQNLLSLQKELDKDMTSMGSSSNQQSTYLKNES